MVYQGTDLIISANGKAVAASKSCSVDVSCDTQKVSSPDDGDWEYSIPGRKKWSISTNQLLISCDIITRTFTVESFAVDQKAVITETLASGYKSIYHGGNQGISLAVMDSGSAFILINTFDTYASDSNITSLVSQLNSISGSGSDFFFLCSNGKIKLTSAIKNALVTHWGVNANDIPDSFNGYGALSLIGAPSWGGTNIFNFRSNYGERAVAKVFMNNNSVVTSKVLKDSVGCVGTMPNIRVNVPGFAYDTLHGQAICNAFKVSGAVGNLLQGSFSFEGSGPLQ